MLLHPLNFTDAGQKQQQRTALVAQQLGSRYRHGLVKTQLCGQRLVTALDRVGPAFRHNRRCLCQQALKPLVVQRCRHNQQFEIVTQPLLNVEQQRQRQIRLQTALVEFIKDHQPHAGQFGIVLDHARQDPFGHHFEPGIRPDAGFRTHPIADRFAWFFIQQFSQPLRNVARRQATRLQQQNAPVDTAIVQNLQRQPGRFTRARWRI